MTDVPGIDPTVPPSGTGCAECLAGEGAGWWFHLRRCATQAYVGGPELAPPHGRPPGQPVPGPAGKVPDDWERRLT